MLAQIARGQTVEVWQLYLFVAGLATADTFHQPARLAMLPDLVEKSALIHANSLLMSTRQIAMAIGFGAGGLLVLAIGLPGMVVLNLLSFILAATLVAFIQLPKRAASGLTPQSLPLVQSVREGASYLRQHPLARPLITMEILEYFPHAIWTSALMLVFTTQALKTNADAWGLQNAIFFDGQVVGALMAAALAGWMSRWLGWVIIGNAFLFSLLTLSYALSPNLAFAVVLCFLFGPTSAMRDVAQDSLLQASVRPLVLGRVYATRNMLTNLNFMLAGLIFAWLADQIPVRNIYLMGGLFYLGTAFYALSKSAIRQGRIGSNSYPV